MCLKFWAHFKKRLMLNIRVANVRFLTKNNLSCIHLLCICGFVNYKKHLLSINLWIVFLHITHIQALHMSAVGTVHCVIYTVACVAHLFFHTSFIRFNLSFLNWTEVSCKLWNAMKQLNRGTQFQMIKIVSECLEATIVMSVTI